MQKDVQTTVMDRSQRAKHIKIKRLKWGYKVKPGYEEVLKTELVAFENHTSLDMILIGLPGYDEGVELPAWSVFTPDFTGVTTGTYDYEVFIPAADLYAEADSDPRIRIYGA